MDDHYPYDGNAEYLDDWLTWMRLRRLKVEAEGPQEDGGRALWKAQLRDIEPEDWQAKEDGAWKRLHQRTQAHLLDPEGVELGLELLRAELGLKAPELTILVAVTVCAISETVAKQTLGVMACGFGVSVNDLMILLGPDQSPHHLEDWLGWRALFLPDGPLVKAGLIDVDYDPGGAPAELLSAWVTVTPKGFKAVTGVSP